MSMQGKDAAKVKKLQKEEKELQQKTAGKQLLTELKEFEYEFQTVDGEKKNIDGAWPPAYNPAVIEKSWYQWWLKSGFFSPDKQTNITEASPTFTILIPPPNITGQLHMGHALTNALQDALVRYYRQSGYRTEWLAGTDHAGISCQVVVEKQLAKQGVKRLDLGREKFVEKVWEWKADYGGKITQQLQQLGSSLDWEREVFTMDAKCTRAHDDAFVRLFEQGLIYRDNRLVGWDCTLQTAISDVEVDYMDIAAPIQLTVNGQKYPFGNLWSFSYVVVPDAMQDKTDEEITKAFEENRELFTDKLTFATTRPETMLGDSALAVNSQDERYKKFAGKTVYHPLRKTRIPIITDDILVDMTFGTGVVKVTPAHDPNDFEAGRRNKLETVCMLQENGKCYAPNTQYHDVPRLDARIKVIQHFTQMQLYEGKQPNKMAIGLSQRSGDVVEPMLKPQWYMNCEKMAQRGLEAVEKGELIINPKQHEQTWRAYLGNIRPWCISRQLWWGHQIPLYKCWKKGQIEPLGDKTQHWVAGRNHEEALKSAGIKLQCDCSEIEIKRDQDVTDTWFSSALFPFSVFGYPEQTLDLAKYFPGSVLETGYDILFFWVARMVMVTLQLFDKLPFKEVLLHAMVRDSKGEKMSKSKGNVVDPLDVIHGCTLVDLNEGLKKTNLSDEEIKKAIKLQQAEFPAGIPLCGTDAMRMALAVYSSQERAINLDINKIVAQRNFCNKIFNATKFATTFCGLNQDFVLGCGFKSADEFLAFATNNPTKFSLANAFILAKLGDFVHIYNQAMRKYQLATAAEASIQFWWETFCDVYVELVKPIIVDKQGTEEDQKLTLLTLFVVIDQALRMISTFMPFLCEEMFQKIPRWANELKLQTVMIAQMPKDCKVFNFGNTAEYANYDDLCTDQTSTYYKLNHSPIATSLAQYETIKPLINAARSLKQSYRIQSQKLLFYIATQQQLSNDQLKIIQTLVNAEMISIIAPGEKPQNCGSVVVNEMFTVFADLKGLIDFAAEISKLQKELEQTVQTRDRLRELVNGKDYGRMPEQLRAQNDQKMVGYEEKIKSCTELISSYQAME